MKPKYRKTTYAAVIKAVEAYVEPCRTIYIARQGVFVYYESIQLDISYVRIFCICLRQIVETFQNKLV